MKSTCCGSSDKKSCRRWPSCRRKQPFVDAPLETASRFQRHGGRRLPWTAALCPFGKFKKDKTGAIDDLVSFGGLLEEMAAYLQSPVATA